MKPLLPLIAAVLLVFSPRSLPAAMASGDSTYPSEPPRVAQADSTSCTQLDRPDQQVTCLREQAFALFAELSEESFGYSPSSPQLVQGLALIDDATAILEQEGQEPALAILLFDTAQAIPHTFITGGVTPDQAAVFQIRDQLLNRAVILFHGLGDQPNELAALQALTSSTQPQRIRIAELAAAVHGANSLQRAEAIDRVVWQYWQDDPLEAIRWMEQAEAIYRSHPDRALELAEVLLDLGLLQQRAGNTESCQSALTEALDIYSTLAAAERVAYVAIFLGSLALEKSELELAGSYYALALREGESPRRLHEARLGLALVAYSRGDLAQTEELLNDPDVYSWSIIATDFHRFFMTPSAAMATAAEMFRSAGRPDVAEVILEHWH